MDLQVMWGNSSGMSFDNAAPASAVSCGFSRTTLQREDIHHLGLGAQQVSTR